jgi:hypothetical protein
MEGLAFALSAAAAFAALVAFANWTTRIWKWSIARPREAKDLFVILSRHSAPFLVATTALILWLASYSPVYYQVVGGTVAGPVAAMALAYLRYRRQETSAGASSKSDPGDVA